MSLECKTMLRKRYPGEVPVKCEYRVHLSFCTMINNVLHNDMPFSLNSALSRVHKSLLKQLGKN